MSYIKVALLLILLNSNYVFAQQPSQSIEFRLQTVSTLIDSAQFNEALLESRQIFNDYQRENIKHDTTEAKIYNSLSKIFTKIAKPDSAIAYGMKVLAILDDEYVNHFERAKAFNNLGNNYHAMGLFSKAIKSFDDGLEIVILNFGEDDFEATTYYGNLSLCYNAIGEPHKAIQYLDKNLDILLKLYGEDHINVGKTYNNLGAVYYTIGDFDKVLDYSFKTLKIKKDLLGGNHPSVGTTYINIGSICMEKGDYEKSRTYIEKAIFVLKQSFDESHPYFTYCHKILGGCYAKTKNYPKAIEHYEKGVEITQKSYGENHFRAAGIYNSLGEVYRKMENYQFANKYATLALNLFLTNSGKNNKDASSCYELLGSICLSKNENDEAIIFYKKALNFFLSRPLQGPDAASPYLNIGTAYINKNDFSESNKYFNKCAETLKYDFNHPTDFSSVTSLIVLRRLLDQKRKYYEKFYQVNQNKKYLDSIRHNDRHALVLEDYFQSELFEQEARTFHFDDAFWRYESAIKTLLQYDSEENLNLAFEVAEKSKSRILSECFRSIEAKKIAGISKDLLDQEHQINIDLSYYDKKLYQEKFENESPNDSLIKTFGDRLFTINQQKEKLIKTFRKDYPSYHKLKYDNSVSRITEIQELLSQDQALVEYFVGDSTIFIFVITPDKYQVKSIEKDFPLEEMVKTFRENIYSFWMVSGQSDEVYYQNNASYASLAYRLHEKLIEPIKDLLPDKLIIVPDGILNFIPFEALLTKKPLDKQNFKSYDFLIKDFQISYNYSATLFKELQVRKTSNGIVPLLALAPSFKAKSAVNIDPSEAKYGFGQLTYNVTEAESIHSLLGGDIYTGNLATKDKLLQDADQYQIIHLSTHGKSNDQMGDYSFVAFSEIADSTTDNERLYVRELYNMKLSADMVVLSACETGLGEMQRGQGIIGLASGFTFAGAKSTITSLWRVNDIQTTRLIERFYKNIKLGMAKDKALHHAKLSFIEEEGHADPYFWSAFIAAGNMAPIDLKNEWSWWHFGLLAIGIVVLFMIWNYSVFLRTMVTKIFNPQ